MWPNLFRYLTAISRGIELLVAVGGLHLWDLSCGDVNLDSACFDPLCGIPLYLLLKFHA